ncbi:LAGLIDADG family homing endonuclease [Patescibacteria group bacterium]|nr:LAGLIDADG family homing endonuclease [Patescibacteria group bacterium]MBU4057356.1 LAGLIDADG family homing endonuclease [Patescibacteria group bacterium]MBU4115726.1 LAGLIDADG family homing endonuclease [Patescibacteria group bacterium]
MGSRSKINLAYIAGFLDGDGSLMLQIKKRSDNKRGIRFMATMCFYQDTRHDEPLYWIRKELNIGYISKRKDGMTELRINGFKKIEKILKNLIPYIKFKKIQAKALYNSCKILQKSINLLKKKELIMLVDLILKIQKENYVTKKKRDRNELLKLLDLTP